MFKRLFVVIMLLLISSALVFAESGYDDQGNPNDPNENERANACYEGSNMEGKCENIWEWECGWYLIQFEYGLLERGEFPTWCATIIPPEILPEVLVGEGENLSGPVCVNFGQSSQFYTGVPNVNPNVQNHIGLDCNNFSSNHYVVIVMAATENEAEQICGGIRSEVSSSVSVDSIFSLGIGYWLCWLT